MILILYFKESKCWWQSMVPSWKPTRLSARIRAASMWAISILTSLTTLNFAGKCQREQPLDYLSQKTFLITWRMRYDFYPVTIISFSVQGSATGLTIETTTDAIGLSPGYLMLSCNGMPKQGKSAINNPKAYRTSESNETGKEWCWKSSLISW